MSVLYKKAMDQIVVSDELRKKALNKATGVSPRPIWIKPALSVAACLAFVVVGTMVYLNRDSFLIGDDMATSGNTGGMLSSTATASTSTLSGDAGAPQAAAANEAVPESLEDGEAATRSAVTPGTNYMIANPTMEYATLEEAVQALSFTPILPTKLPDGITMESCSVIKGTLLEVNYQQGENNFCYRTAADNQSGTTDISGDYNQYDTILPKDYLDIPVTLKGNQSTYSLAIWSANGQLFSVSAEKPLTLDEIDTLVQSLSAE